MQVPPRFVTDPTAKAQTQRKSSSPAAHCCPWEGLSQQKASRILLNPVLLATEVHLECLLNYGMLWEQPCTKCSEP